MRQLRFGVFSHTAAISQREFVWGSSIGEIDVALGNAGGVWKGPAASSF